MARLRFHSFAFVSSILIVAAVPGHAVVPPQDSAVRDREFRHDSLRLVDLYLSAAELRIRGDGGKLADLGRLGVAESHARMDVRSGRWGTLMPARPLLPGDGAGNDLAWSDFGKAGKPDAGVLRDAAWTAFVGYLEAHRELLRIDPAELSESPSVTVHGAGELIQIHAPRTVAGIPVRDSYLTAVIDHGNLVLFGAVRWGDVVAVEKPLPAMTAVKARDAVVRHLAPLAVEGWREPELAWVPAAPGTAAAEMPLGQGLDVRLAWVLGPAIGGEPRRWQALVDARDGGLLLFEDLYRHVSRREVHGGVFPISNDGAVPTGVEQPEWPMPFSDVLVGGKTLFANSGGVLEACVDGEITTTLSGQFVRIADDCGAVGESTTGDVLDLGTSAATDCDVPPGASPGNTHAARTVFYHVNRIREMARALLPRNAWLHTQLTAATNTLGSCGGTWSGGSLRFLGSAAGVCANAAELASVVVHEWGHGMDDNDANPSISSPGEGIADVFAYLRLGDSCIGRGFRTSHCGGYGDACTDCTGVRDVDWEKRTSGAPHDVEWIDANCSSTGALGPCFGTTHCEGAVVSEAVFDLVNRDLPALYGIDLDTAREIGTRMTYLGAGPVGDWFDCVTPFGGCGADAGYLNFLAADDDNGDLGDGTPHMQAIYAAFDRHQIACDTPAVQDGGCAGTPVSAPGVTVKPGDGSLELSWTTVAAADSYNVYRTEGVSGCDSGKVLVAQTTDTSFVDEGLKNGREYFYVVLPMGPAETCFGPASSCASGTPEAGIGDPCAAVFGDDFESGDASAWE